MKHLLIVVCLMLLITACHDDPVINVTRIIKNNTEKVVNIKVYSQDFLVEDFIISSFNADTLSAQCAYAMGILQSCSPSWVVEGYDSAQVIFDNQKRITYCLIDSSCDYINGKNMLFLNPESTDGSGYIESEKDVFIFTIEESDYELAEPIINK